MAKRVKPKKTKTQVRKESLLRQVRRMEAKGYIFNDPNVDIREFIHKMSPQKAVHFTTENLYKIARAVNPETGEIIPAAEHRAAVRREAARKAAETRRRKKAEEAAFWESLDEEPGYTEPDTPTRPREDQQRPYDITEEVLSNFQALLTRLEGGGSGWIITKDGKRVPAPETVTSYVDSVRRYLTEVFEAEKAKDRVALARRIHAAYEEIDQLIGEIEYAGYKDAVRTCGDRIIRIMRGTDHLSMEDRMASEDLANSADDYV